MAVPCAIGTGCPQLAQRFVELHYFCALWRRPGRTRLRDGDLFRHRFGAAYAGFWTRKMLLDAVIFGFAQRKSGVAEDGAR